MGEIKVGDKLYSRDGRDELTVYHIGARTIKAARGGVGGYPDYTIGRKSLMPVGGSSKYGPLLTAVEAREKRLARMASHWIQSQFESGEIAAKDVIRVARMLGWGEAGNGRA